MLWVEGVAATFMAAAVGSCAWRAGRSCGRAWVVFFAPGLLLLAMVALSNHLPSLADTWSLAWLQPGRRRQQILALAIPSGRRQESRAALAGEWRGRGLVLWREPAG